MGFSGTIEHLGVINELGDTFVRVKVKAEAACGNCRAKGSCSIGAGGERTIEVARKPGDNYSSGEPIKVVLEQSLGMKALGLGYFLPFLLVLVMLATMTTIGLNEGMAGLLSLSSLIPYYLFLGLFREKLKKEFSFRLRKV